MQGGRARREVGGRCSVEWSVGDVVGAGLAEVILLGVEAGEFLVEAGAEGGGLLGGGGVHLRLVGAHALDAGVGVGAEAFDAVARLGELGEDLIAFGLLLLAQLLGSARSRQTTWDYIKSHWAEVSTKVGSFQGMPTLAGALGSFCSTEASADVKAFFDAHPVPEVARTLQQSFERMGICVAVDARQSPAFTQWLARQ